MKLSIIIVSWNTRELTLKCLKSIFSCLEKTLDYEIFLVDNNSSDNMVEAATELTHEQDFVAQDFSPNTLNIIKNKQNLGFAKANNIAIKQAKGDYILLLNSDTELIDNSLNKMIEFIDTNNKIGIVGPKLINTDGTLQRSCRRFPGLVDQLFIQLKFYNFWPNKIPAIKKYFMLDFMHDKAQEVDQVMGAAMLIKKKVINKIGLLDEKFWVHFEEVDFCKRAKDVGWQTYFYPDTQIVHHKEASFKQIASFYKQINFNYSLRYYFKKHKPFWQLLVLCLIQPINLFLIWVDSMLGIRNKVGKRKDL